MRLPRRPLSFIFTLSSLNFCLSKILWDGWADQRTAILMSYLNCPRLSRGPWEISSSSEHGTCRFSSFESNMEQTDGRTDRLDLLQGCIVAFKRPAVVQSPDANWRYVYELVSELSFKWNHFMFLNLKLMIFRWNSAHQGIARKIELICDDQRERRSDRRTDGQTNTNSHRDATTHMNGCKRERGRELWKTGALWSRTNQESRHKY